MAMDSGERIKDKGLTTNNTSLMYLYFCKAAEFFLGYISGVPETDLRTHMGRGKAPKRREHKGKVPN